MMFSKKLAAATLLVLISALAVTAQTKFPSETKNAALRYWMAFAQLQDTGADESMAGLLGKTINGEAAWDEAKLGPIVDDNMESIGIMQRATRLPECDWGLEYSLGPRTPIAFVKNSARALARLNTLYGIRLAAKGDTQGAVDTWIAGIRFSQDIAKGGSLFATLVANAALSSDFRALTKEAQSGALNAEQRKQVESAVRVLPLSGFDWGTALWFDGDFSIDTTVRRMREAASPASYYKELMGEPAPDSFSVPQPGDLVAYHKILRAAEEALRLPPEKAQNKLKALEDSLNTVHPFLQRVTPRFTRINETRIDIEAARQKLLQAVSAK